MSDNEDELNSSLTSIDWLSKMTSKDLKVNERNTLGEPLESDHIPDFKLIDEDSQGHCESSMFDSEDPKSKPRHSYATLIRQAIENSENQRATLSEIYQWITDRYPFYRNASSGWKNSIRHNLSLSKCFLKVQRGRSNPGKGCYWAIIKHNSDDSLVSNDPNNSVNFNTGKPRVKKSRVNDAHAGLTPEQE
ncbi:hypothetical protein TCAL_12883 [Tigriopus californicus]|uniref:Fork-head domain-containing protein n=1 Tax=Tigriopus californicus TaxID=6832 RepID=A0A553PR00_TIGCA|nr:hypothetical protein TCAL_12883 [Tigriopus californicus]